MKPAREGPPYNVERITCPGRYVGQLTLQQWLKLDLDGSSLTFSPPLKFRGLVRRTQPNFGADSLVRTALSVTNFGLTAGQGVVTIN